MSRLAELSLLPLAVATLFMASVSTASALEDGDTVRIVVGFSPGGGYDTNARLAAPYLEAALRERGYANTSVVVENVTGGAGVMGATTVFNSKPDGTTLGILEPMDAAWQQLLLNAPFDVTQFNFLSQHSVESYGLLVRSGMGVSDFEQIVTRSQEKPILLGTPGRTSNSGRIFPVILQQALAKADIDLRFEYLNLSGTGDVLASLRRGDSEGFLAGINPVTAFVKEGNAKVLFSFGNDEWPGAEDVLKLPPEEFGSLSNAAMSRRVYIAPPGMDAETLKTLRDAFEDALNSKELRERSNTAGFPVTFLSGEETQKAIAELFEFAEASKQVVEESLAAGQ